MMGVWEGFVALRPLSNIKKGTSPFDLQSNEPLLSLYDNSLNMKSPSLKKMYCSHITLYLGNVIALPMIVEIKKS